MLISLFGSAIWGSLFVLFFIRFIRLFIYLFAHFCVCCCFKCLDDFDSDSGSTTLSLIRVEHTQSVLIEFGFRFDVRHTRSIILGYS